MYEEFLAASKTIPYVNRDFIEWHRGISHYGFWAVIVDGDDWINLFDAASVFMEPFIHSGYRRAPHITIAACGLLSDEYYSAHLLDCQLAALSKAPINSFMLKTSYLNSFASAPYITIEDPTGALNHIRRHLMPFSKEDNPARYQPHMTLGLYRDVFKTQRVADHIEEFPYIPTCKMLVTEIAFCVYETNDIQGPITVLERVEFESINVCSNQTMTGSGRR